jgi:hypothetical protein
MWLAFDRRRKVGILTRAFYDTLFLQSPNDAVILFRSIYYL